MLIRYGSVTVLYSRIEAVRMTVGKGCIPKNVPDQDKSGEKGHTIVTERWRML